MAGSRGLLPGELTCGTVWSDGNGGRGSPANGEDSLPGMDEHARRRMRSDAARNRERLVEAARRVFAEQGLDAPLEDIAQAAEVSRTTLYRNFDSRGELAAQVYEGNVAQIEQRASELAGRSDGAIVLFDFVLDMQEGDRSIVQMLSRADIHWFQGLSVRTARAFEPLIEAGRRAGLVREDVTVADFMLAFPMSSGVLMDPLPEGHASHTARMRVLLHRALFTRD